MPGPALSCTAGWTKLASPKILQRGIQVDPAGPELFRDWLGSRLKYPSKISSKLGREKIFRSSQNATGLMLRETARAFLNVTLARKGRKPSRSTGSRNALVFSRCRAVAAVARAEEFRLL
jgi:hypothetical protein